MKATLWYLLLAIVIGTVAMAVWHYFGGLSAFVVIIIPLAIIANGWVATWDDEQPGGFSNPLPGRDKQKQDDPPNEA